MAQITPKRGKQTSNKCLPHNLIPEILGINKVKPDPLNPNIHTDKQTGQIAKSIASFGFIGAIFVDENYMILIGHGRWLAAKLLGMKHIPVIVLRGLTKAQKKALSLADNKIAENSYWDDSLLADQIREILDFDVDFDLDITGFETGEIDFLLDEGAPGENPLDCQPQTQRDLPAITRTGDIWNAKKHQIICGDSRHEKVMRHLMQGCIAQIVFTDPPYNVKIDGHVCGSGSIKHNEFAMASGEMSDQEFFGFLTSAIDILVKYSADGSIHYICMDWRHIGELLIVGNEAGLELKNICVWKKNNGGMGSLYRSRHEFVAVFKSGTAKHINNVQLGKHGRNRTNVWEYPGVNTFGGTEDLAMHPTVKPCALVMDVLKDCSNRGDIVLDTFGGSGTSLIAAEKTGRHARLVEIDPYYVDTTIRRWQTLTGQKAVLESTGQTFDEVEAQGRLTERDLS